MERLYHIYYTQVKQNLLPTAIQVVLLVNISQLLTTCLKYYLQTTNHSSAKLLLPISMQCIIFVITIPMLRLVSAEIEATSQSNEASAVSASGTGNEDDEDNIDERTEFNHDPTAVQETDLKASSSSVVHNRRSHGRSLSSQLRLPSSLSRCKLSLPYLLWFCQLMQLASCHIIWPYESFNAYLTLLLYSYAIYVILPLRLHSCILLAVGLSVIELVMDYMLWLNLGASSANDSSYSTTLPPQAHSNQHYAYESQPSSSVNLAGQPSGEAGTTAAAATAAATTIATSSHKSIYDSALFIPMTSQLSKFWTFMILALGVNAIGIMCFFFYERQQRAAFLETRQSLETKLTLEKESREQERLLLSILPKHLASEIRQDLGAVVTGQFKKIYMSRHENVSILFADIVGFTAISSNCPAHELVKILNELFARFDKLAEKYHQLRIKILGDCYYAISGAPEERSDHAVLCVHMGLSMVDAIRSVREQTKSVVDMRVGVHTGGVLAGVLGQRQWQFDVYSKDVELANKMESSGLPGRVHISDATLRYLNDEFEISEGDGASREEALRLANIKTYFIDRVKRPYPEGTLDAPRAAAAQSSHQANSGATDGDVGGGGARGNMNNVVIAMDERTSSPVSTIITKRGKRKKGNSQSARHKQHNDSLNSSEDQMRMLSLNFRNRQLELQFRSTSDITSCISLVGLPVTLVCALLAYIYLYGASVDLLTLVTVFIALFLINRQFELTNRRLFLWRKQVEERKEKVADMRQKNEALVYNILPRNVARIFLNKQQLNDEELYSKSYDAVGVLFAAMPNFSDFYTEESVNNQGLECLRFLNEVISDYDALLDQPRFKNIIKIKTMGPTYMAASGLYEGDARAERSFDPARGDATDKISSVGPDGGEIDELRSKWGHLVQLTEFALALKETLNNINKESFNNFVLRIGINHGPITAGVIGVKKPHFDMWGNTVNVASRMESTGRAGSIQVVDETATILKHFGFQFDQRGIISVKGKGQLMTHYLIGKNPHAQASSPPSSPT